MHVLPYHTNICLIYLNLIMGARQLVHLFFWFLPQEEYDTHDPKGHCSPVLPFLMKRTKVIEIVAARDIVFALAHSGVCAAFSRGTTM